MSDAIWNLGPFTKAFQVNGSSLLERIDSLEAEATSFEKFKSLVRCVVDEVLVGLYAACGDNEVVQVARYASLATGHRWRVMVAVAAGQIFGRPAFRPCLPCGVGVELAHCASIILDDLPSMDDGHFRRGKPCPHRIFPRWAVDLAPVFMINAAYGLVLGNAFVSPNRRIETATEIGAAGQAMIAGQAIDLTHSLDDPDASLMLNCYRSKSGALYASAAKAGAVSSGASESEAALLYRAGMRVGISYQFMDDVADATASFEATGKLPGQDAGKPTAIHFHGVDGARALGLRYREEALDLLAGFGPGARLLCEIANRASWAPI